MIRPTQGQLSSFKNAFYLPLKITEFAIGDIICFEY